MLYSAIRGSNCGVRGIFDIFCIETQQLQLAWHAVGVSKGGGVAKRVSENNLPPRATHTRTPPRQRTQGHTCAATRLQSGVCPFVTQRFVMSSTSEAKYCALKSTSCPDAIHRHILDLTDLGESQLPKRKTNLQPRHPIPQVSW